MDIVLQILLGLLIPIGWGLLSAYLYDRFCAYRDSRRCRRDPGGEAR